jgi:hypothetical protein
LSKTEEKTIVKEREQKRVFVDDKQLDLLESELCRLRRERQQIEREIDENETHYQDEMAELADQIQLLRVQKLSAECMDFKMKQKSELKLLEDRRRQLEKFKSGLQKSVSSHRFLLPLTM